MIVAARDVELNPGRHVYMSGDTKEERSAPNPVETPPAGLGRG
jgi:hypothetical protein